MRELVGRRLGETAVGVSIGFLAGVCVGELGKENTANRQSDGEESVKEQHGRE